MDMHTHPWLHLRKVEVDESWIDAMERKEAKEKEARGTRDETIMGIS